MQIHIENLNINIKKAEIKPTAENCDIPAIGEKWPGLEAVYAGLAPNIDCSEMIHLIVWPDEADKDYEDGARWAEQVRPDMGSHLPTDHQSITLRNRLAHQFNQNRYYWTLTKRKDGNTAFVQVFYDGFQSYFNLYDGCLCRAVSEIPL